MMKLLVRFFLLLVLGVGNMVSLAAQDFPKRPVPPRIVNDLAGILSDSERQSLERKLVDFNDSTSTQIAVVTVKSLKGYDPADYAVRLLDLWGIGQKGKDNGILILVKPKTADEKGQVAISVGYGLEAVVPDATADMIVRNEMIPSFRENDYYTGIDKATDVLIQLTRREYTADEYSRRRQESGDSGGGFSIIVFIIIIIVIIAIYSGRKGRGRGIRNMSGFPPYWGAGGFGGGRGGGSSSGGGGFGGFGGGRGGGGGASGSW